MNKVNFSTTATANTMSLLGAVSVKDEKPINSAYSFTFENIDGSLLPLSKFRGQVILIVNTASECGFTKQYKEMQELWDKYKEDGLVVIAVPSNDFGSQEPANNEEIAKFCELNFGITFPITAKQYVVGDKAHPFYQWARLIKGIIASPKWNFHKYLINKEGKLVDWFSSMTKPSSKRLIKAVEEELKRD